MNDQNNMEWISIAKTCLVAAIAYWALGPIGLAVYALYKLCRMERGS